MIYLQWISFVFFLISCSQNIAHVFVKNNSNEIINVTVRLNEETAKFDNLLPGQVRDYQFKVVTDGQYKIIASFQSGEKMELEAGYVTSGFNYKHYINVGMHKIELTKSLIDGEQF